MVSKIWVIGLLVLGLVGCGATAQTADSPTPGTSSHLPSQSATSEETPNPSPSASSATTKPAATPTPALSPSASPSATRVKAPFADLGLTGTLFFHRYERYGDWEAQLFGLDLATGRLVDLSANWNQVVSPINAHLNPAGDAMVFMGSNAGLAENEWDVFVSHWNGSTWVEPVNLTGPNDKRDEDPKFSPNGHTIAYKQNGVLATMEIDGSDKQLLTLGKAESSMPYFTADGSALLFERAGSICLRAGSGAEERIWKAGLAHAYYPIGVDASRFLFTEVQITHHDRIDWGFYDGRAARPLFFARQDCDQSDPYPYESGERFIFYVTGCVLSYKGGYNLAVADLQNRQLYSLEDLNPESNSSYEELGPAWSGTAHLPNP